MNMRRCNIEKTEHGIRLCMGEHERSSECKWEHFVAADWQIRALAAEAERDALKAKLENRNISTHADGCWAWGHRHWECAVAEIERLTVERDYYLRMWQGVEQKESVE